MMFCTELDKTSKTKVFVEVPERKVTEVVEKRSGMAFLIEYKSSVSKLPPISVRRTPIIQSNYYKK